MPKSNWSSRVEVGQKWLAKKVCSLWLWTWKLDLATVSRKGEVRSWFKYNKTFCFCNMIFFLNSIWQILLYWSEKQLKKTNKKIFKLILYCFSAANFPWVSFFVKLWIANIGIYNSHPFEIFFSFGYFPRLHYPPLLQFNSVAVRPSSSLLSHLITFYHLGGWDNPVWMCVHSNGPTKSQWAIESALSRLVITLAE